MKHNASYNFISQKSGRQRFAHPLQRCTFLSGKENITRIFSVKKCRTHSGCTHLFTSDRHSRLLTKQIANIYTPNHPKTAIPQHLLIHNSLYIKHLRHKFITRFYQTRSFFVPHSYPIRYSFGPAAALWSEEGA